MALVNRITLPHIFCSEVRKRVEDLLPEGDAIDLTYEDHSKFTKSHDEQLLLWLNR